MPTKPTTDILFVGSAHAPGGQPARKVVVPMRVGSVHKEPLVFGSRVYWASHWSPRVELAGTYDEKWAETRRPLLPLDYDVRHELCAPADQRPGRHPEGGEPVELVNLSPRGDLRFHLPMLDVSFVMSFGKRRVEHGSMVSTVTFDPERERFMMVWQSSLEVAGPNRDYLEQTTVRVRSP